MGTHLMDSSTKKPSVVFSAALSTSHDGGLDGSDLGFRRMWQKVTRGYLGQGLGQQQPIAFGLIIRPGSLEEGMSVGGEKKGRPQGKRAMQETGYGHKQII